MGLVLFWEHSQGCPRQDFTLDAHTSQPCEGGFVMRPGAPAADVAKFLSQASDDSCCAWLCATAGARTREEDAGVGEAVMALSRRMVHSAANPPTVDMLRRVS